MASISPGQTTPDIPFSMLFSDDDLLLLLGHGTNPALCSIFTL